MQHLKTYLEERRKFLQEVANADASENAISVLAQIHEIKVILNWIEEHEHTTDKRTYKDGVKDAYNDVLHMIYADGCSAEQIKTALEKVTCNN